MRLQAYLVGRHVRARHMQSHKSFFKKHAHTCKNKNTHLHHWRNSWVIRVCRHHAHICLRESENNYLLESMENWLVCFNHTCNGSCSTRPSKKTGTPCFETNVPAVAMRSMWACICAWSLPCENDCSLSACLPTCTPPAHSQWKL